jgi:hypothetical protein
VVPRFLLNGQRAGRGPLFLNRFIAEVGGILDFPIARRIEEQHAVVVSHKGGAMADADVRDARLSQELIEVLTVKLRTSSLIRWSGLSTLGELRRR